MKRIHLKLLSLLNTIILRNEIDEKYYIVECIKIFYIEPKVSLK